MHARARVCREGSSKAQTGGGWSYEQEGVPSSEQDRWERGQQAQIRTQEMGQAEAKAGSQTATRIVPSRRHYPERESVQLSVAASLLLKCLCLLVCWARLHFLHPCTLHTAPDEHALLPGKHGEWEQGRVHLGITLRLASLSSHVPCIFLLAPGPLSRWPSVLCFCGLQTAEMTWGSLLNSFAFK